MKRGQPTFAARLFVPIDGAWLAFFRIAFGTMLLVGVLRYVAFGSVWTNWVQPDYHFSYLWFTWLEAWEGDGMFYHFHALAVLSAGIALGWHYRTCAVGFFLGFAFVFLTAKAKYLNHFYLIVLLSFLMIFLPANRTFSVDAFFKPQIRRDTVPTWTLWLLRFQIGIVYFFAGIAKLNIDWLRGEPMRMWLAKRADRPVIGPLLETDWAAYTMSYGGLLLDLLAFPCLLWRKTRVAAVLLVSLFHLTNFYIFNIGIFPWLMLAATTIFFEPDWPRRLLRRGRPPPRIRSSADGEARPPAEGPTGRRRWTVLLLGVWAAVQVAVPLRHHLYPGWVHWTEEGHRFSWRMKLRSKRGAVHFIVKNPRSGKRWKVNPRDYLSDRQVRSMTGRPDMILEFAHHLAKTLKEQGAGTVEVTARAWVALNGRRPQLLIDPNVDLARVERSIWPANWILPLREKLRHTQGPSSRRKLERAGKRADGEGAGE